MKIDQLYRFAEQAVQKMNTGDFESALNLAYKARSLGSGYFVSYIVSGLLIDIGVGLMNEKIVKEGIELLERNFETIIRDNRLAPTAYYNLGNGYYAVFKFKMKRDPYAAFLKESELDQVRAHYRKALKYDLRDAMLISQIWVNLGNCFDSLGRVIDALECYEESLKWRADHGMALGNKGIALCYYSEVSGEHQGTFLVEAHSLLSQALKLGVPHEAINTFSEYLKDIEEKFSDKQILKKKTGYPGCAIKARSKFDRFLQEFCLTNKLYLNICDFCQKCDAAVGDTAVIKKMIVQTHKDSYLHLSAYLNQIKQDYVVARFLLILSRYRGLNLNFVDKNVTIINTLDHSVHNIYIQLVKTSFKIFYDILDKIACFINDYLELGISQRKITFRWVWYARKNEAVRKKIQNTGNFSLNALFDIYRNFENGPYEKLRNTRNALTHRFVNVRMFQELEDEENMTEDTLVKQTIELARIVRSAFIYLLHFVHVEENKKELETSRTLRPLFARELPDKIKKRRL